MVIEWGTALYQLLAFAVLLLILSKFALKPLLGVMQKRQDMINEQIDSAEQNRKEAEKLLAEQREEMQKARVEARELIENAKKQANSKGRKWSAPPKKKHSAFTSKRWRKSKTKKTRL